MEKNSTETYGILQTAFGASSMNQTSVFEWHKRFKEGRESMRDYERCGMNNEHQSWSAKGLGLLCWGFKGSSGRDSVERGQHSSNWVSGISSRTMHWSTTASLSQISWQRLTSRQFVTLLIVQTLLPVTFGYSISSEAALWDNWVDERGCDEGHWHAHTRGLSWGLQEVVGMVEQVHCSRRQLLRRGLVFHVCTINKRAHTKKSGNLSYAPRI